jgi:gluconolactonase
VLDGLICASSFWDRIHYNNFSTDSNINFAGLCSMLRAECIVSFDGGVELIFATGLGDPEGPVVLPDGTWLVVEGTAERGCVTQISSDGHAKRVIQKTGLPNGLAVDHDGVIWVAESKVPSLIRLTMEGKAEVVATECDGEQFLFPNDLCFGPDGGLYLTDSGILVPDFCPGNQIRPDYMSLKYDGRLYRVDIGTGKVTQLDSGILFTNGIAFGPDGLLYVNETITGNIYRYELKNGSLAGPRTLFGNVIRSGAPPGFKGPDGMAFSADGRLYVTVFGQHDIIVLGEDGQVVERMETAGNLPTNVAFALPGSKRIAVTEYELGQMEMYDVPTDGLSLW